MKFKPGDKVICNGNPEGRVIGYYSEGMVEVRLWNGSRLIGSVVVPECDVQLITQEAR